jgi:hypothetical protein
MRKARHISDKDSGSITFRHEGKIINELRKEAAEKRLSLNTLASQIFQSHLEYHRYSSRAGMVSFPKGLLLRLMERLSEEEVALLSEYVAKNDIKEVTLLLRKEYSLPAFLDMIESWLRVSGFPYRRDRSGTDESIESFIIEHDMGNRWSLYFEKLFRNIFEDFDKKKAIFQTTDNTIAFKVDLAQ